MAYELKDNSGSLFKNDEKESKKHPDYKGQAKIEGIEYWLSAWVKESKSGKKFLSLSIQPKDERKPNPKPSNDEPKDDEPKDDDLPF